MAIGFRTAQRADIEAVLAMMREFYAIDGYPFDEAITRVALETFVGNAALGALYLIEDQGRAIGYLVLTFSFSFEFHGRDAFLDELFLAEEWRGKGIGTEAMRFLEQRCREFGVTALHLEVECTNEAGLALYRKFGFADHDRYLMTKRIGR